MILTIVKTHGVPYLRMLVNKTYVVVAQQDGQYKWYYPTTTVTSIITVVTIIIIITTIDYCSSGCSYNRRRHC